MMQALRLVRNVSRPGRRAARAEHPSRGGAPPASITPGTPAPGQSGNWPLEEVVRKDLPEAIAHGARQPDEPVLSFGRGQDLGAADGAPQAVDGMLRHVAEAAAPAAAHATVGLFTSIALLAEGTSGHGNPHPPRQEPCPP